MLDHFKATVWVTEGLGPEARGLAQKHGHPALETLEHYQGDPSARQLVALAALALCRALLPSLGGSTIIGTVLTLRLPLPRTHAPTTIVAL
jgi:hypothetical protein